MKQNEKYYLNLYHVTEDLEEYLPSLLIKHGYNLTEAYDIKNEIIKHLYVLENQKFLDIKNIDLNLPNLN